MTMAVREVSLALPPRHWAQLPLDDPDGLRRLVTQRVGGAPQLARFRAQVHQNLCFLVEQAKDRQVLTAASMTLALEGEVVGASLFVALWRHGHEDLHAAAGRWHATVVTLPRVGRALRARQLFAVAAPLASYSVPLLRVQYAVPVLAADVWVLLTFTSPSLVYETALVEMFDMIASSVSVQSAKVDDGRVGAAHQLRQRP